MSCYSTLYEGGYKYTTEEKMRIYIYPNDSYDRDNCQKNSAIPKALKSACETLTQNWTNIGYYSIKLRRDENGIYYYPNIDNYSSRCDLRGKWGNYFSSHGCGGVTYDSWAGCHLLVDGGIRGGCAAGNNAFDYSRTAVVGTSSGRKEEYKNTAIQETLHTFLDKNANEVSQFTKDSDHDLGKVYNDGSVSPMASGYEGTHARHGDCTSNNWFLQTYKTDLTGCTIAAMDQYGGSV